MPSETGVPEVFRIQKGHWTNMVTVDFMVPKLDLTKYKVQLGLSSI